MHKFTADFVKYCQNNFDLNGVDVSHYQSLSVCLIDCIYSLRAKYYTVTVPIVDRYAERYMNGNKYTPGDTVSMLLSHIDEVGGPKRFADLVLNNHQELGGQAHIPKEQVLYRLASYLKLLHIETVEDFRDFESQELLEIVIRAVKGVGDAGTNYLFMLAGNQNRCKPDVHIHHCIKDACGETISNDECQVLFQETVQILKRRYPNLTVRGLDSAIWTKYQAKS